MPYNGSIKHRKYLLTTYGSPFIDSHEVIVHLKELVEVREIPIPWIEEETGIPTHRLRDIRNRRQRGVRKEDAAAILSYQPTEAEAPSRAGRELGVLRILQGLSAKGMGSRVVAAETGFAQRTLNNWRIGGYRTPTQASYRHLVEVAQHLEGKTAQQLGVSEHAIHQVGSRAKRSGWVPLAMWDWETIHDPAAFPDWTGLCGTVFGYQAHRRQEMEPICEPCREARRVYQAQQREAKKLKKEGVPDELG